MSWKTPIGDARTNLHARHHHEHVQAAQTKARIALETGTTEQHPNHPRPLPGDPIRLRGIPVLVEGGIGGAITGTRPDTIRNPG
jgi:hypothetical protein